MSNSSTTWDIVDLIAMIVEVFIMEAYDSGHEWRVNLHIPMSVQPTEADQQIDLFKDKWIGLRSDVPVRKSD
eukprot:7786887-Prorocentrum_lima.AAC.1